MLLYCTYQYIYNLQCLLKKTVELNFKKNANDLFFSFFTGKREREGTFDMLFHKKGRKEKEEGITRQGLGRI